jgi:hypothetical protein
MFIIQETNEPPSTCKKKKYGVASVKYLQLNSFDKVENIEHGVKMLVPLLHPPSPNRLE